jgi:hypothetical protein
MEIGPPTCGLAGPFQAGQTTTSVTRAAGRDIETPTFGRLQAVHALLASLGTCQVAKCLEKSVFELPSTLNRRILLL